MNKLTRRYIIVSFPIYTICANVNGETISHLSVESAYNYDDNLFRSSSGLSKSDDSISIKPLFDVETLYRKQQVNFSYTGDYNKNSSVSSADYYDHDLEGALRSSFTEKLSTLTKISYKNLHEEPAEITRIQQGIEEYNRYEQKEANIVTYYGRNDAIGKFTFDYRYIQKDYENDRFAYLNYDSNHYRINFSYRLATNTRTYIEAIINKNDFQNADSIELDNSNYIYRVGVDWQYSEKLNIAGNFGYQERDYEQENLNDTSGVSYNLSANLAVNSYSKVNILASRESLDSSIENAGALIRDKYTAEFTHKFTNRLTASINFGFVNDELAYTTLRKDKFYAFETQLNYNLFTEMDLFINAVSQNRNSNFALANFDNTRVSLGFIYSIF